ncbi:hypothetical protein BH20VER3_BH20VER3_01570 [soil metagenome]
METEDLEGRALSRPRFRTEDYTRHGGQAVVVPPSRGFRQEDAAECPLTGGGL